MSKSTESPTEPHPGLDAPLPAQLVIRGLEGTTTIPLLGESVVLGRATDCDVTLKDGRCSRHHARVEARSAGYRVVDLDSQNGTWRNGRRVRSASLAPGDVLVLGQTKVSFQLVTAPPPEASTVTEIGGSPLTERLEHMARLTAQLNRDPCSHTLFEQLLDAAIDLTRGERGFLILRDKDGMRFAAARGIEKANMRKPEFEVSWSIAIQVGTRGESILAVNAQDDPRFRAMESVEMLGLRSVLCVPVVAQAGILGVIYVDNRVDQNVFDEHDERLLETFADQAAIALTNRNLLSSLRCKAEEVEELNRQLKAKLAEQSDELSRIRAELAGDSDERLLNFRALLGESQPMVELRHRLSKAAPTDFPVLIEGESGTGKELVARCLWKNSSRGDKKLVSLNCAAVPETLLESELFGFERGAFTGANQARKGLFELADGGTLFLDEVASMSPGMQSRLLRAVQESEVRRLGGKEPIQIDVRLIAASNRPLATLIEEGVFREDLYYRLRVLPISVPPLRDRREDLPALIQEFLAQEGSNKAMRLTPDAMEAMSAYNWPGNVRQLQNEVRRLSILAEEAITKDDLSTEIKEGVALRVGETAEFKDLSDLVGAVEVQEITKAMRHADGNKTRAAGLLGITRFTLQRKLEKYNLQWEDQ